MTKGTGHVIDPDGHARRALAAAVAQYGPQGLANPAIMDGICRDRLGQLPGETILIGSAARADVPALLRARMPAEGADGAIASVARTLAETHALDPAACAWVVREYARALGLDGRRRGNRNALGVVAAVALVVVYLGVAAVAHLSPFPAKAAARAAATTPAPASPAASPDPAPDADPDPSPPSAYATLLSLIPASVQGHCRTGSITVGATAVADCGGLGLAATGIKYYLFPGTAALQTGFTSFLTAEKFTASSASCTTNHQFVSFVTGCQDSFTSTSPTMTGRVAEYVSTQHDPIIVSTDNQQLVMAVLVGTNDNDLLAYWKPLQWVQG